MKKLFYSCIIICMLCNISISQTIVPGCTTLEIVDLPSYPGDLLHWYDAAFGGGEACNVVYLPVFPTYLVRTFTLFKKDEQGNFTNIGTQISPLFTNVDQGTYRVRIATPYLYTTTFCSSGFETFNQIGQSLGYLGDVIAVNSDEVVIGPTAAEDRVAVLTGSTAAGAPTSFNAGDDVFLDATESQNYTMYFLAIKERGAVYNRYASTGWVHEQAGIINLYDLWNGEYGYNFEIAHSYEVQFVIENRNCRHGIESPFTENVWWDQTNNFFVCDPAWMCREGMAMQSMKISPNPAGSFIQVSDFNPAYDTGYILHIYDLAGRMRKHIKMEDSRIDISDLQNGMYVLQITKNQLQVLNTKLIVNN